MIHTRKPSQDDAYWKTDAPSFSRLYGNQSSLPLPAKVVAAFLASRTTTLLSMLHAKKNDRILDIGCGSGVHMAELIPISDFVAGADYSEQMIKEAAITLSAFPKRSYKLVVADAAALPFGKRSFDRAIAMGLMDYVPNPGTVLVECRRVLKKGGTLVISIPKRPSLFGILRTPFGNGIKRILFHLPPVGNAKTREELPVMMEKAGFRIERIESVWDAMWMVAARAC